MVQLYDKDSLFVAALTCVSHFLMQITACFQQSVNSDSMAAATALAGESAAGEAHVL